jgi:hypothetical protein
VNYDSMQTSKEMVKMKDLLFVSLHKSVISHNEKHPKAHYNIDYNFIERLRADIKHQIVSIAVHNQHKSSTPLNDRNTEKYNYKKFNAYDYERELKKAAKREEEYEKKEKEIEDSFIREFQKFGTYSLAAIGAAVAFILFIK